MKYLFISFGLTVMFICLMAVTWYALTNVKTEYLSHHLFLGAGIYGICCSLYIGCYGWIQWRILK